MNMEAMALGRPRKKGRRWANGNLVPQRDHGAERVVDMRRWLSQHPESKGDPTRTSYPLGIAFTTGQLDEHQWKAGCRFAFCYGATFGHGSLAAASYGLASGGVDFPPGKLAALDHEAKEALQAMDKMGRQTRDDTVGFCVFERAPRWMTGPYFPRPREAAAWIRIRRGLSELAKLWGYQ